MKKEAENDYGLQDEAVGFKKVMRGFDPEEVISYIEEMNLSMRDAAKNYEIRMAEMNQELTLANRETGSLRQKCAKLEQELTTSVEAPPPVPSFNDAGEKEELTARIKELTRMLEEKEKNEMYIKAKFGEATARLDEFSEQLQSKEKELAESISLAEELRRSADSQNEIRELYESALGEIDSLRTSITTLSEENDHLENNARDAEIALQRASDENNSLKSEINRLNVENLLLVKKNEQHKAEITELKNEAKSMAYTYAEKLTEEKAALDYEKVSFQKKLQLQSFHIEQAASAIDELKKQIEQIRITFKE